MPTAFDFIYPPRFAWIVFFLWGNDNYFGLKSDSYSVRVVRGGQ